MEAAATEAVIDLVFVSTEWQAWACAERRIGLKAKGR